MDTETVKPGTILEWSQPLLPKTRDNDTTSAAGNQQENRVKTRRSTSTAAPQGSPTQSSQQPPTIKNHSTTYHGGYLYCFGGYDGRLNHMTLRMYSIAEKRWSMVPYLNLDTPDSTEMKAAPVAAASASASAMGEEGNNANDLLQGPEVDPFLERWCRQESADSTLTRTQSNYKPFTPTMGFTMSGTPPAGRNGHTQTKAPRHLPDGTTQICLFIIGGWLGSGPLAASDLHILDITHPEQGLTWLDPSQVEALVSGPAPGPCNMHSADYISSRGEIYVFRGGDGQDYLNDLHALHTSTLEWRIVETKGEQPQQRANHSSAFLADTEELILMGGWNGRERLNDVYILDTTTSTWSKPEVGGVMPPPRAGMTLTPIRNRLYLFGGSGRGSKCFSDMHVLDRDEMAWLEVVPSDHTVEEGQSSSSPNASASSPAHFDPDREGLIDARHGTDIVSLNHPNHAIMVDRSTANSARNHSANPNEIESLPSVAIRGSAPTRRAGHTATAVNDRFLYLFGGSCGTEYLKDFYLLDTDPPEPMNISTPTSLARLSQRLRHYCNRREFSDVVFIVEGREIYAHKLVLSLASEYYGTMFTKGFLEEKLARPEIVMEDVSYEAFLKLLEYIYSGEYPSGLLLDAEMLDSTVHQEHLNLLVDLLILADRLLLDNLKQRCEQHLQPMVTSDTVESMLPLAQKTNAKQLEAFCWHYQRNEMDHMKS